MAKVRAENVETLAEVRDENVIKTLKVRAENVEFACFLIKNQ